MYVIQTKTSFERFSHEIYVCICIYIHIHINVCILTIICFKIEQILIVHTQIYILYFEYVRVILKINTKFTHSIITLNICCYYYWLISIEIQLFIKIHEMCFPTSSSNELFYISYFTTFLYFRNNTWNGAI